MTGPRFIPADDRHVDSYEIADSAVLGIGNESGDIVAYVRRADGSRGYSFGGPVYSPSGFMNSCTRSLLDGEDASWCSHELDMTEAECFVASAFAHRVGWLVPGWGPERHPNLPVDWPMPPACHLEAGHDGPHRGSFGIEWAPGPRSEDDHA